MIFTLGSLRAGPQRCHCYRQSVLLLLLQPSLDSACGAHANRTSSISFAGD
jgi:hypothetical protein